MLNKYLIFSVLFFVLILFILILYGIYLKKNSMEQYENYKVAVMPNQFIQSEPGYNPGNNLDNILNHEFAPDNMDLRSFFTFTKNNAKYFPRSYIEQDCYYEVPRDI